MTAGISPGAMFLTDAEVDGMCEGLTNNAAKARWLRNQYGLTVGRKPNGRPLVLRSHADAILSGLARASAEAALVTSPAPAPNRAALIDLFTRKRVA